MGCAPPALENQNDNHVCVNLPELPITKRIQHAIILSPLNPPDVRDFSDDGEPFVIKIFGSIIQKEPDFYLLKVYRW